MSEFDNVTAPPPAPAVDAPQDDRTLALLTHLSGILLGFIVPLVVWLLNKDKPEKGFLNDQAKEALNFQITVFLVYIVGTILTVILIGALVNLAARSPRSSSASSPAWLPTRARPTATRSRCA